MNTTESGESRVRELERRIHALEAQDEDAFGRFNGVDWIVCIVGAILIPALVLWWYSA